MIVWFQASEAALTQFLGYLSMLIWLAVGGPLLMIGALASTFDLFPAAQATLPAVQVGTLIEAGSVVFAAALQIALPVIVALTIVNVALGVLARSAPQMNLISVGFPITLMVGLVAFGTALPYMLQLVERNLPPARMT